MPKGQKPAEKKEKVKSDPNAILPGMIRVVAMPAGGKIKKDPTFKAKIAEDEKRKLEALAKQEAEKAQKDAIIAKRKREEKISSLMTIYQTCVRTGVALTDKIKSELISFGIIDSSGKFLGSIARV